MNKLKMSLATLLILVIQAVSFSQPPAPPQPPACPSGNENRVGGGAMLEDSLTLVLGLVFLFGAYKAGKALKKLRNEHH